jgi:hypothetical protein
MNKLSSMLDTVADSLEARGLIKEAYELDKVANEFDEQKLKARLIQRIRKAIAPDMLKIRKIFEAIGYTNAPDSWSALSGIVREMNMSELKQLQDEFTEQGLFDKSDLSL